MLTNIKHYDFITNYQARNETWEVVYTKSRREKKVAGYFLREKIKFYLPLETRIKCYGSKKVHTTLPLFPGYIFCSATKKAQYELLLTHDIVKILSVSNQCGLKEDLEKIYLVESLNYSVIPYELVKEGQRAKIESGPLQGFEGVIASVKGKNRLILNVDFINRAAAVEIDRTDIVLLN